MKDYNYDHYRFAGQDAARAIWGTIPAEGYPVTQYTLSGSWQARAWRAGYDFIRQLQEGLR